MHTVASGGPHEERLIEDIMRNRNYTALARPVAEESEAVVVTFGLSLQQIIRVVSCKLVFINRKLRPERKIEKLGHRVYCLLRQSSMTLCSLHDKTWKHK